jgi:hypothetical protein
MPSAARILPALVAALLAAGSPALAQGPTSQVLPTPTAIMHDEGLEVPAAFASPPATMRTFLGSFHADVGPQLETAASCLDLAKELGVEFAFPTRTLYLRREEWSAPAVAGDDYPAVASSLSTSARERAGALVGSALGGEVPPPVSLGVEPEENRGDSGE